VSHDAANDGPAEDKSHKSCFNSKEIIMKLAYSSWAAVLVWGCLFCWSIATFPPTAAFAAGGAHSGGPAGGGWWRSGNTGQVWQPNYSNDYPTNDLIAVKIVNPAATNASIQYSVEGRSYSLPSGRARIHSVPADAVIEFGRGGEFGAAQYALTPGTYTFEATPKGLELFHHQPRSVTPLPPVKIVNPAATNATISFSIDGQSYSLPPGKTHLYSLRAGADSPIEFGRGGGFGDARYTLNSGTYTFAATPKGWNLFQGEISPAKSSLAVKIVNPAATQFTLNYSIDGTPFHLEPGKTQDINVGPTSKIEFGRGQDLGVAKYDLHAGTYTFVSTTKGWELLHGDQPLAASVAVKIVNPVATKFTLNYSIDGTVFHLDPGKTLDINVGPTSQLEFGRGQHLGVAKHQLHAGTYTFKSTPNGWDVEQPEQVASKPTATPSAK
jgi:hypothetical protein